MQLTHQHLAGLKLALTLCDESSEMAEALQAKIDHIEQLPLDGTPIAWIVEFDSFPTDDAVLHERHVIFEEPTGHYVDCATAVYASEVQHFLNLLHASRNVLTWVAAVDRPVDWDEFEVGRMAGVRMHALADLQKALEPLESYPAQPVLSSTTCRAPSAEVAP
jgi:hypothetical protein